MQTQEQNLDVFEEEIKKALKGIGDLSKTPEYEEEKIKLWTREVKRSVSKAIKGLDKSYKTCYTKKNRKLDEFQDFGEWLYDLIVLDYDDDKKLRSVPLVLESEWGNSKAIDDDFQKLVVARADYRVMVFSVKSDKKNKNWESKTKEIIEEKLLKHVNNYKYSMVGDRYMFACFNDDKDGNGGRQFHFSVYVVS